MPRASMPRLRRSALLALAAPMLAGCSDDDEGPTTPDPPDDPPMVFEVPADGTLAEVVAMTSSGDTVRVAAAASMDTLTATLRIEASDLVIIGRSQALVGEERPVLNVDAQTSTAIYVDPDASGVEIHGLELRGTFGIGVRVDAPDVVVHDCWIEDAVPYAISLAGDGSGTFSRNVLAGATAFGVQAGPGTSGVVRENTIVGAGDCGVYASGATLEVTRNVIYDSFQWGVACFGSTLTLSCNVIHMSGTASYSPQCTPGAGDVEQDPELCADGTYAVEETSPCVPGGKGCGWIGAVQSTCEPPPVRLAGER